MSNMVKIGSLYINLENVSKIEDKKTLIKIWYNHLSSEGWAFDLITDSDEARQFRIFLNRRSIDITQVELPSEFRKAIEGSYAGTKKD